jgi:hypothetical protein
MTLPEQLFLAFMTAGVLRVFYSTIKAGQTFYHALLTMIFQG